MMTKPCVVLVHSPFVGSSFWAEVAQGLAVSGRQAICPHLTVDGGLLRYEALAQAVVHASRSSARVELVLHSGAGGLAEAIVDALGERASGILFVDAILPHAGRSWLSTLPPGMGDRLLARVRDARLPPWDEWFPRGAIEGLVGDVVAAKRFVADLPRLPVAFASEVAPMPRRSLPSRRAYLRLSEAYESEASIAEVNGWRVRREASDHLAPLTKPLQVADMIQHELSVAE